MVGELIDLISGIAMGEPGDKAKDLLGRVYEYFLGGFAGSEGKRGGEFYTPRSVVRVLVEMLEPYKGGIYDPCKEILGLWLEFQPQHASLDEGEPGQSAIHCAAACLATRHAFCGGGCRDSEREAAPNPAGGAPSGAAPDSSIDGAVLSGRIEGRALISASVEL
jgi:hypothetical protein